MKKHGETTKTTKSVEYRAWQHMIERCTDPGHPKFSRYGGRGITVDSRWLSFENFLEDMDRRPSAEHSLERKNNAEGYSKENCKWATRIEQQNNTSTNRTLTWKGETLSVSAWARKLGMKKETLAYRLRSGWSIEEVLSTPRGAPTGVSSSRYPHQKGK